MGTDTNGYIIVFFFISAILGFIISIDAKSQGFNNVGVIFWGIGTAILPMFVTPAYILFRVVTRFDGDNKGLAAATVFIYLVLSSGAFYVIYHNVNK